MERAVNGADGSGGERGDQIKPRIVNQWQDSGSGATNEHWNVIPIGDGTYPIVNVNRGLDLEIDGTTGRMDQWADVAGAANEHWTLTVAN